MKIVIHTFNEATTMCTKFDDKYSTLNENKKRFSYNISSPVY